MVHPPAADTLECVPCLAAKGTTHAADAAWADGVVRGRIRGFTFEQLGNGEAKEVGRRVAVVAESPSTNDVEGIREGNFVAGSLRALYLSPHLLFDNTNVHLAVTTTGREVVRAYAWRVLRDS